MHVHPRHCLCMHNTWKDKRQISWRTSRGLYCENKTYKIKRCIILKKKCCETMQRHAVFLVRQLQEINFAIGQLEKLSQQGLKRKISRLVFKLFLGKGFTLSKYSPVTIYYSPATAILNKSHDTYCTTALAHADGTLRKSYKSILSTVLEDSVQVLLRLPGDHDDPLRANITDGMAAVQMIKTASVQAQASHFFENFFFSFGQISPLCWQFR